MKIAVTPGKQYLSNGSDGDIRGGRSGEIMMSNYLPRYAQAGIDGDAYAAANIAAQAVSVALATAYTGLVLYNPVGSGVILVPTLVKFALSVAPAAIASIGLIAGFAATGGVTAFTTPLIPRSTQIGNSSIAKGQALSAATLTATPVWLHQLYDGSTAAALPAPQPPVDLQGAFQILPGGYIAIGALTAISGLGSIVWHEVPA
jgi:hypothetical protein